MKGAKKEQQAANDDVAATYNAFKEFEGRRYTGMRIGTATTARRPAAKRGSRNGRRAA